MLSLGVGAIVGSGIFVLTGVVARDVAGPGVVVSYVIASLAALLSALAYAELAVAFPSAGGAFSFSAGVFGELTAWISAAGLVLEYGLSAAAVARGFTSYAAALFGKPASSVRFPTPLSAVSIDPIACACVLIACALLAVGVREANWANALVNGVNVALIVFITALGLTLFTPNNLTPFAPFGAKGILGGAAIVFFSFIGADSIANAAEECEKPSRDLPLGIVGSVGIATILYVLMALTIVGMVPFSQIDPDAPFSAAFASAGKPWAGGVVAAGALTGIATSVFVALYSQTRLLLMLGRSGLLPPVFGRVAKRTQTPVVSTAVTGGVAGVLALLFDIDLLAELVSLGTLVVYTLVLLAVLVRRYQPVVPAASSAAAAALLQGGARTGAAAAEAPLSSSASPPSSPPTAPFPVRGFLLWRLVLLVASAMAAAACFHHGAPLAAALALAGAWLVVSLSFLLLKPVDRSHEDEEEEEEDGQQQQQQQQQRQGGGGATAKGRRFLMPCQPLLACCGVASTSFLLGSLGWQAYLRWVVFMVICVGWYVFYGMWKTGGEATGGEGGGGGNGGGVGSGNVRNSSGGGGAVELGLAASDRRPTSVNPLLAGEDGARQPSSSGGVEEGAAGGASGAATRAA
jgi:APA family basic amino acid/polyamine antiporter